MCDQCEHGSPPEGYRVYPVEVGWEAKRMSDGYVLCGTYSAQHEAAVAAWHDAQDRAHEKERKHD